MNRVARHLIILVAVLSGTAGSAAAAGDVHVMTVDGVINPVAARTIAEGIQRAEEASAAALVVELDTPGGLMKSVHEISKSILNSDVPVVVYVWPEGARATSAGVLVTISGHVAAMARGTHIGAAHVVTIQGAIQDTIVNEKAMNDWVAELQSVARLRGRNTEWVELAARESKSLVAEQAVELGVVDLIAVNLDSLLVDIDGWKVDVGGRTVTLETAGATVVRTELGFRDRFLNVISDPSIAYILFIIGLYGLIFELMNPGSIFPGVVGAICILVALYAMHTLPINYAGVLLILLGIALFIAETQVASFGLLTLGGVVSMVLGSMMLLRSAGPIFEISLWVILPTALATAAFFLFAVSKGLLAQRRSAATGREGLVGEVGVVQVDLNPDGKVFLHGEIWSAVSRESIRRGERVRVVQVDGMRVTVERAPD